MLLYFFLCAIRAAAAYLKRVLTHFGTKPHTAGARGCESVIAPLVLDDTAPQTCSIRSGDASIGSIASQHRQHEDSEIRTN